MFRRVMATDWTLAVKAPRMPIGKRCQYHIPIALQGFVKRPEPQNRDVFY